MLERCGLCPGNRAERPRAMPTRDIKKVRFDKEYKLNESEINLRILHDKSTVYGYSDGSVKKDVDEGGPPYLISC